MVDLSSIANIVSGVGSVAGLISSSKANENVNKQLELSQQQASNVQVNQAAIQELARSIQTTTEGMTDQEAWGRAAGIYNALLRGESPMALDVFKSQFDEIEYAAQAKLRETDAQAETARRQIASSVPAGGLKLRMLAEIATKAQDQKAVITNAARDEIKNKNLELRNTYLTKALSFGEKQGTEKIQGYQTASGVLQGYPTTAAASPNTALQTSYYQGKDMNQSLGGIGESIAKLSYNVPTTSTQQPDQEPAAKVYTDDSDMYKYRGEY